MLIQFLQRSGSTAKTIYRKFETNIPPETKLRGITPNSYIHVSVSDFYIPTIGLPILQRKIGEPILRIYKGLAET